MVREREFLRLSGLQAAKRQIERLGPEAQRQYRATAEAQAQDLARRVQARIPVRVGDTVPGGTLRRFFSAQGVGRKAEAIVGIERVAIVVRRRPRQGLTGQLFVDHRFRYTHPASGKAKTGRRVLSRQAEERLRAGGAEIVRPGKYGHLVEFGHGGPHPAPAHPFLRPTVAAFRPTFEAAMRGTAEAVAHALAQSPSRAEGA